MSQRFIRAVRTLLDFYLNNVPRGHTDHDLIRDIVEGFSKRK